MTVVTKAGDKYVCDGCRSCGESYSVRIANETEKTSTSQLSIRCPDCRTPNACIRELPGGERPTIPEAGPDWFIGRRGRHDD